MPDLGMFEETGALLRTPGGNVENIADQKPVIRWAALNVGGEVERDPSRWKRQLSLYADAGVKTFPWLHCRTLSDVDFLVSVGTEWRSPVIGLNIEDVVGDELELSEGGAGMDPPVGVKSEFGLSLVVLADARPYAEGSHD